MAVNKDQPGTWIRFRATLCQTCIGTCCTMPVEITIEDLIRLGRATEDDMLASRSKLVSRLKKEGLVKSYREATGKFMLLSRPNGDCPFLSEKTRLCTVYGQRPQLCRDFPMTKGNRLGHCPAIRKSTESK